MGGWYAHTVSEQWEGGMHTQYLNNGRVVCTHSIWTMGGWYAHTVSEQWEDGMHTQYLNNGRMVCTHSICTMGGWYAHTVSEQWEGGMHTQYSSTCHEGTLPVRSQSVPSWQVVRRGWDRHFDTHIYGHTSIAHIVNALLMHTQTMSESNENRETPITCTTCSICTLHGINRHNTSTIVCKCSDYLFQTNVYIKCNLDRSHTHTHASAHAHIHTTRNMAWGCVGWQEHDLQAEVGETSGWAIIRTICVFPQAQPSSIATARHEWPASNRFRTSTRCCWVRIVRLLAIVTTLPNQNISPVWRVFVESLTYFTSSRGSFGIAGFLNPAHFYADNRGYTQT